jgi:hypothetical protein
LRIYHSEIRDGLARRINSSVATLLVSNKIKGLLIEAQNDQAKANSVKDLVGYDQNDLAALSSILVTTGWNLNDDVFLPSEVWAARNTPRHKPINYMHDSSTILGHIISANVVDKNGNIIVSEENLTEDFEIEVAGVLYKNLFAIKDLVDEVIEKSSKGEMFVSMECWFNDFDYAFLDKTSGVTQIINRNESTAFLTKHLRAFGGSGEFNNFKVGRVFRNIVFGGEGLVDNPANPRSVIKSVEASRKFKEVDISELSKETKGGIPMAAAQKTEEVKADNASVVAQELETASKALAEANENLTKANQDLAKANESVKTLTEENAKLTKEVASITEKFNTLDTEVSNMKKDAVAKQRLEKLSTVRKIEDEKATLAELREMSDETFNVVMKYSGNVEAKADVKEEVAETEPAKEEILETASVKDDIDYSADENVTDEMAQNALATAEALLGRGKNKKNTKKGVEE